MLVSLPSKSIYGHHSPGVSLLASRCREAAMLVSRASLFKTVFFFFIEWTMLCAPLLFNWMKCSVLEKKGVQLNFMVLCHWFVFFSVYAFNKHCYVHYISHAKKSSFLLPCLSYCKTPRQSCLHSSLILLFPSVLGLLWLGIFSTLSILPLWRT